MRPPFRYNFELSTLLEQFSALRAARWKLNRMGSILAACSKNRRMYGSETQLRSHLQCLSVHTSPVNLLGLKDFFQKNGFDRAENESSKIQRSLTKSGKFGKVCKFANLRLSGVDLVAGAGLPNLLLEGFLPPRVSAGRPLCAGIKIRI